MYQRRRWLPGPAFFRRESAPGEPLQHAFSYPGIGSRRQPATLMVFQPLDDAGTHRSTRPVVPPLSHNHPSRCTSRSEPAERRVQDGVHDHAYTVAVILDRRTVPAVFTIEQRGFPFFAIVDE
jgi:hypothetical protein